MECKPISMWSGTGPKTFNLGSVVYQSAASINPPSGELCFHAPPASHEKGSNGGHHQSPNVQMSSSSEAEVRRIRALPAVMQERLAVYPDLVKRAFMEYAMSGDARASVEALMKGAPEFLLSTDSATYRESPLGVALLKKKAEKSRFFIRVAREHSLENAVLSHRNTSSHTLLMLSVDLNNSDCADILITLLEHDPAQIYRFYDSEGRNVFHHCVADGFAVSFRIILEAVLMLIKSAEISVQSIQAALSMTDRQQKTPIHYMAEFGDVEMFNVLDTFARSKSFKIDYDSRFNTSDSKTPLMVAVESGKYDVCKWLLEKGRVDLCKKHMASCFTALHFAVRLGNAKLIRLLRVHGAMPEFYDEDCEGLDEYKTPLQLAASEQIPDKRKCLRYLEADVEQLKKGYSYTMDSFSRSSSTPSLPLEAASFSVIQPHSPAKFLSRKKVVQDLQLFGSERREKLSQSLGASGKSELFVQSLLNYVPELAKDAAYLRSCSDRVFDAIVLLSDTEHASRLVIKQVLLDIGADDLVELVIPATTS